MKEKYTVALIGCGAFAKSFVPLFKAHPYVEKFYVCDLIPEKAAAFCETYGVESIPTYEEVLARPDIDAVAIVFQCTRDTAELFLSLKHSNLYTAFTSKLIRSRQASRPATDN